MALILNKESKYGVSGNYWRITDTFINYIDKTVFCSLYLYKDTECRLAGKDPLDNLKIIISLDEVNQSQDIRVSLYTYIKSLEVMSAAIDG